MPPTPVSAAATVALSSVPPRASRRPWIVSFVLLALLLAGAGYTLYQREAADIADTARQSLATVGTLKAGDIQHWRQERQHDGQRVIHDPNYASLVAAYLQEPGAAGPAARLQARLQLTTRDDNFATVLLADLDGRTLISSDTTATDATERLPAAAVAAASASADALLTDLRLEPRGRIVMDVLATVRDAAGHPLALLVLRDDVSTSLYPLLWRWPTPSPSAETLLVARDGDTVVYLHDLRHQPNSALRLHVPLSATDRPSVQAVNGRVGPVAGHDYRGVAVLADVRPIADSPWFLVAKVDAAEMLGEARVHATRIGTLVGGFILLAGAVLASVYRRRQAAWRESLHAEERRHWATQEEYGLILHSIADAVITTDTAGRVTQMNAVAAQLTGWPAAEAIGQPVTTCLPLINETTRAAVTDPVALVLRDGKVVGLANHTLLLARDGREIPIADSAAPIHDHQGAITGVVLVFRDQTQERAAQRALDEQVTRLTTLLQTIPDLVWLKDPAGVYLQCNAAFERFTGRPSAQVIGQTDAALFAPAIAAAFRQHDVTAMAANQPTINDEELTFAADGYHGWFQTIKTPMRAPDGALIGVLGVARDISAVKRAEAALRQSEEQLRYVIAGSQLASWDWHIDTGVVVRNDAWAALLGFPPAEVVATLDQWRDRLHPDDQAAVWQAVQDHFAGRTAQVKTEYRIRCQDGHYVWVADRATIVQRAPDGQPLRMSGTMVNITARVEAQAQLRASEERFRGLFAGMQEGCALHEVIYDASGQAVDYRFLSVNPAFERLTGLTAAVAVGHTLRELLPASEPHWIARYARVAETGEPAEFEDYSEAMHRHFAVSAFRPAPGQFAAIFMDTTERMEAAAALRASEERYRRLVDTAMEGLWVSDREWRVSFVNPVMASMVGYTVAEMLGRHLSDFTFAEDEASLAREHAQRASGLQGRIECRLRRRDGTPLWVLISASPQIDQNGQFAGAFAMVTDISARKEAEAALQREQEFAHTLLDNIADGVVACDAQGKLVLFNRLARAWHGLDAAALPTGEWSAHYGLYEPDAQTPMATDAIPLLRAYRGETIRGARMALCFPAQPPRQILAEGGPFYDAQQHLLGAVMVLHDITASLAAEAAVRTSEARYRTILSASPDTIVTTDLAGHILMVSPAGVRMFNLGTEAAVVGRQVVAFVDPQDRARAIARLGRLAQGELPPTEEYLAMRADGSTFAMEVNCECLRDAAGQPVSLLFVVRDITARKAAEAAVRAGEARYRTILSASPDTIATTDLAGRILMVSPAGLRMFHYEAEDVVLGRPLTDFLAPTDHARALANVALMLQGTMTGAADYRGQRADGSQFDVEINGEFIRDDAGQPQYMVFVVRDISARKEVEAALHVVQRGLERAQELAHLGNWEWDVASNQVRWSAEIYRIYGWAPTAPTTFATITACTHPADAPAVLAFAERLVQGLDRGEVAFRILRPDGTVRHIYQHAEVERQADGTIKRIFGTMQDTTERAEAQAALELSEQRFRGLLQNVSSVAVQGYSMDGTTRYWNRASELLYGYTAEEALGCSLLDLVIPPEMHAGVTEAMQHMATTREPIPPGELSLLRKDGSRVSVFSSHAAVQVPGRPLELFCIDIDLTALKQAEGQLRLLGSALAAAANAIVITNRQGRIEWVNTAFTTITGYTAGEALGQTPALLKSGQHDAAFYQVMWRTILAGEVWHGELINRAKNGRLYHEDLTITPLKEADGTITHFISVRQDITKRKLLEAQFHQAQKVEAVGRLAGGVAHDFNNMLFIILGHAEMALQQASPSDPLTEHIREILNAGQRSAALVRQLLAFARKQTIAPQVVQLNDAIASTLKMLRRLLGEDITLAWQPAADLWPVHMDPGQVDQLLANLTVNARDAIAATGSSAGTITIRTERVSFDAAYVADHAGFQAGDYVLLAVADTGCGMAEETMAQIFEPFFTTKEQGQGTGLGLATVYGIVSQNHGFIKVHSQPGQGATFALYLPAYHATAAATAADGAPAALPTGTETILLVEDEPAILMLTRLILERLQYQILSAGSPAAALQLAQRHAGPIHLLLTDVVMPGMNGRELYEQLRAQRPALKCVYMSGYTADAISPKGVLAAGVHFLQKPCTREALATKLRVALAADVAG